MTDKEVGQVTHYYSQIDVAVVKLSSDLEQGSKIRIKGHTTDFEQVVNSMQMEHKNIQKGANGQEIGLKVNEPVRTGDKIFLI